MCSPNFAYIEGYHFGATEIPRWFVIAQLSLWIALGLLVTAALIFILIRYPSSRKVIMIYGVISVLLVLVVYSNTTGNWCRGFGLVYPTNQATIQSIERTEGIANHAYFHTERSARTNGYWPEQPVDISHTRLRFVCVTERCSELLDISANGTVLTILTDTYGTVYSCIGTDEIAIHIPAEQTYPRGPYDRMAIPENCTVRLAG